MAAIAERALRLAARQVDQNQDKNIGSAQSDQDQSATAFGSSLAPIIAFTFVWLVIFVFLRPKFPERYSPRSHNKTIPETQRSPAIGDKVFNWFGNFFALPDTYVLTHSSLDGYLFLRFLKIVVVICLVGCLITWPVLFPVNATGGGGKIQFNLLTLGNIDGRNNPNTYYRYFAHTGCAYLFFGFIMFMITRESIYFINLRQAFLMAPLYASRLSSKTVLFTSVPEDFLDEVKLRKMLGDSVVRIWLPTDTKDLEDLVKETSKTVTKLEAAETKLCKLANAARLKAVKKGAANESAPIDSAADAEAGTVAARWIKRKDRPTHRLKPIIGQKVDTIDWCRAELPGMLDKIKVEQEKHKMAKDVKKLNSVFVQFNSLVEAQAAYQSLTHHQVLHMAPRYTGLNPAEVIWSNLRIRWYARIMRKIGATSFVVALIIFWSVPVAFVGAISNVNKLVETLPWLGFLLTLPPFVLGLIKGLLPSVLLAVLMALLPIILRLMAKISGDPTLSSVELTVQNYYFAFQVVQVFLVATLGSAASSSVGQILQSPTSVTSLLATNIPLASNFYLSYLMLQGLSVVAGLLLGLVGLVISKVLAMLLDNTPRKVYRRWTQLAGLSWGTVFPIYTNLAVIGICYACIAPLVLAFAAIGLYLFYLAYRYNMLFVYNLAIDTKGLVYPRALQQLFVGLYIAEVCLIGLFAINSGQSGGALGSMILMIVFLIFTALYNISLNSALGPSLNYMPKSLVAEESRIRQLEDDAMAAVKEERTNSSEQGFATALPAPHGKPSLVKKFLRPDICCDYETMRRIVPREFATIDYDPATAHDAYRNPAVTYGPGVIWIPRDGAGVSQQECRDTSRVIPCTDDGAHFNEKNKIVWDREKVAPIYEPQVLY